LTNMIWDYSKQNQVRFMLLLASAGIQFLFVSIVVLKLQQLNFCFVNFTNIARLDFFSPLHYYTFPLIMELNNDEIRRYSRHLILPEVGLAGQKKSRPPACCASARAASARPSPCISPPPASARSASWISTRWIFPTCNARFSTRTRTWAARRPSRPRKRSAASIRIAKVRLIHNTRIRPRTRSPHPALRHRRGRHG